MCVLNVCSLSTICQFNFRTFFVCVELFVFGKTGHLVCITSFGCRDNETNDLHWDHIILNNFLFELDFSYFNSFLFRLCAQTITEEY